MPTKPAYAGEAQLIRWSDSLSAGRTLTLKIEEEGDLHPFKGIPAGQRMQIVCVLVNDDEEPIGPEQVKKNATRHKARLGSPSVDAALSGKAETVERTYTLSQKAALKLQDRAFRSWLLPKGVSVPASVVDEHAWFQQCCDRELKRRLGITSKRELDEEGPKARAFEALLTDFDMREFAR